MNRRTKSIPQALERLAEAMGLDLEKRAASYRSKAWAGSKTSKRALGILAWGLMVDAFTLPEGMTPEKARTELVRWYGRVPTSGLPAHELEAVQWLRLKGDS